MLQCKDMSHFHTWRIILGGNFYTDCLIGCTLTQNGFCSCSKFFFVCIAFGASALCICHEFQSRFASINPQSILNTAVTQPYESSSDIMPRVYADPSKASTSFCMRGRLMRVLWSGLLLPYHPTLQPLSHSTPATLLSCSLSPPGMLLPFTFAPPSFWKSLFQDT